MTILERTRGARIRSDATQLADELAKRLPDLERTRDQAASAVHGAAGQARHQLDRAAEAARVLRGDIAHAAEQAASDNSMEEVGQRIRAASATSVRAIISRLEKALPEVDRDRYERAEARGRAQARSGYLVVGLVAGVGAGIVAAILLDPTHGRERRAAIVRKARSLARRAREAVSGRAVDARETPEPVAVAPAADTVAEAPAADTVAEAPAADTVAEAPAAVLPGDRGAAFDALADPRTQG